jgi:hypothetical protein
VGPQRLWSWAHTHIRRRHPHRDRKNPSDAFAPKTAHELLKNTARVCRTDTIVLVGPEPAEMPNSIVEHGRAIGATYDFFRNSSFWTTGLTTYVYVPDAILSMCDLQT